MQETNTYVSKTVRSTRLHEMAMKSTGNVLFKLESTAKSFQLLDKNVQKVIGNSLIHKSFLHAVVAKLVLNSIKASEDWHS